MNASELRKLRKMTKMSQEKFAALVGLSASTISRTEQGGGDLKAILDQKREAGPMAERIKASGEYGTALAVVQQMEKSIDGDDAIIAARKAVDAATADLMKARGVLDGLFAAREVEERKRIRAVETGEGWAQVRTGMTFSEVVKVAGEPAKRVADGEVGYIMRWERWNPGDGGRFVLGSVMEVTFDKNSHRVKLVNHF